MNQKLVTLKDTGFKMAKIPKVLFHGTTKLRYEVGIPHNGALTSIKNEGLRSDVPPHMKVDLEHLGWVYLCGSIEDAKFYALYQVEMDNLVPELHEAQSMVEEVNCGSIIAVRTSLIKDSIEEDPEYEKWRKVYRQHGIPEVILNSKTGGMYGKWYRHKGNIPKKFCMGMYDLPISSQSPMLIEIMKAQANERYETNKIKILQDLIKELKMADNLSVRINENQN